MKKVFLSLITVFMVLSLSVVLVKASEATTVELVDGVQIRTDGNNGLKWVANVTNHNEGNEYGFLFAKGELESVTVDTPAVVKKIVEGVSAEETTMQATMVKFPTDALVQDISVVAYAYDGENYAYSNVVVRNLSEVAVEAYKNGVEGDFIKTIYDASKVTFDLNGGELTFSSYSMSDYNHFYSTNGVMLHGKGRCSSTGSAAWASYYDRIFMKFDAELDAYRVVASNADKWSHANYSTQDFDLVLMNIDGATDSDFVEDLTSSSNVYNFVFKINSDVVLDYETADKNIPANVEIKVYKNEDELIASEKGYAHLGGGVKLPTPALEYYDFVGWCDNKELEGDVVTVKGNANALYAKYTPINYSISYVLRNGAWNEGYVAPTSYNYESEEIQLPTAANLSINDGAFVGWYDNIDGDGSAITSIPSQSNGDIKLYAVWKMNGPVEVELNSTDETIIGKYLPNLFVSNKFASGKFIINDTIYEAGVNAFTSISAAINAANENDIIYVFSGEYDENVDINVPNLTLLGANADVDPNTGVRGEETTIKKLTVSASDVKFNGFYFVDRLEKEVESILVSPNVSNCTLAYNVIANQTKFNTNSVGLIKITGTAGQEVNNLTIQNFKVEKGSMRPTLIHGYGINNLTVKDSVFLGSALDYLYTDAVKIVNSGNYGIKGNVTFTGNTFKDYGQYLLWFASCANVNINVTSNKFIDNGQSNTNHAAVYVHSAASSFTEATVTMLNNVVDNSYMLLRVAAVSKITANNFVAEVHNNSVLNSAANVHIKNESSGIVNAENNYYDVAPTADKFTGVTTWEPYLSEDPNK